MTDKLPMVLPAYVARMNASRKVAKEYQVILEDGSSNYFIADNKTGARKQMNKYLRDLCGFGGRYGGKLPKIAEIR